MCGGYCKLVHLVRATRPRLRASDPLQVIDAEVRECFTLCTAVPVSNLTWQQAQLSLSHGGLGLRSVSHDSSAAYIASLCFSGFANRDPKHLARAVDSYNSIVFPSEIVTVASILASPMQQRAIREDRGPSILNTL